MFSKELMYLLLQVIKSWQVIAVTIAIILYMFFVSYVARIYHRPRSVSKTKARKKAAAGPEEVTSSGADTNDELGLEEM
jgi:hypothetical protein